MRATESLHRARGLGRLWPQSGGPGHPSRARFEPWRDWAVLAAATHGLLITAALTPPGLLWLLVFGVLLGLSLAVTTLTVLHDAGHRRFARQSWPNVLAVQAAAPFGLWAGHWTRKHRVHHRLSQVYPIDESTRSSALVRLHPSAPSRPIHRWQHLYVWGLYGLAWAGELRSQLRYLRTGVVLGCDETPSGSTRTRSFISEKLLCLLILLPYARAMGVGWLSLLLVVALTLGSVFAAIILVVGHINEGLEPSAAAPSNSDWAAHLLRTTASFSTDNRVMRWITGGMTHHLAHHLRPVAPRHDLPELHRTLVAQLSENTGLPAADYPSLAQAIRGHYRRLRELGPGPVTTTLTTQARGNRISSAA